MVGAGNKNCYEMVQIDWFAQIHLKIRSSSKYFKYSILEGELENQLNAFPTETFYIVIISALSIHFPNICFFLHVARRLKAELQNSFAKWETATKTKDLNIYVPATSSTCC